MMALETNSPTLRYAFGPVPSRRLGQSLGVDTIPLKTCNWNCVYCQLGRTMPVTNERRQTIPRQAIIADVREALAAHKPGEIDWVTFVGSGEPTLHADTGWLIRRVRELTHEFGGNKDGLPVAVITNGSLLYLPEVREELAAADAVLPTLDAGDATLYRKINRPHPEVSFARLVEGLVAFREMYTGHYWVEVMLVRGMNDTEEALYGIAGVLERVRPDEIHINLPTRPPAEPWVKPPNEEGLMRALPILGNVAKVVHPVAGRFDLGGSEDVVDAIIGIITRHPMEEDILQAALDEQVPEQAAEVLARLKASGRAQRVTRHGVQFWSASPAHYPDKANPPARQKGEEVPR